MASKVGMTWTSDTLTMNVKDASRRAQQFMTKTTAYYSLRGETFAKSKAPWTDRTGNARSGLSSSYTAELGLENSTYTIELYHRVSYGIWLEVRWNGRWGIINKATEKTGQDFFKAANNLMASMFGGS